MIILELIFWFILNENTSQFEMFPILSDCVSVFSHTSETTHWLDPRLAKLQKQQAGDCNDDGKSLSGSRGGGGGSEVKGQITGRGL